MVAAGYQAVGLDHFALPDDGLAVAARTGDLRRNFQGYTTDRADALIGLGASSIGRTPSGFVQNVVFDPVHLKAVKQHLGGNARQGFPCIAEELGALRIRAVAGIAQHGKGPETTKRVLHGFKPFD